MINRIHARTPRALVMVAGLAVLGLTPVVGAGGGAGATELMVTATIRDFADSHADFCKPTSMGANWVEGAFAPALSADGRPVYTGGGRRVTIPATDAAGNFISSRVIAETALVDKPDVLLVNAPTFANAPKVDTYNPNVGPYGGGNVGPAPEIATGQAMPVVNVPNIGPYVTDYIKQGNASTTLNSSFRCAKFVLENGHTLTVQGDVTVVVDELLNFQNGAYLNLAPGARLTIYSLKDAVFQNSVTVNMNTGDPSRFTLYKMGGLDVEFGNAADVCGTIICPQGRVLMHNDAEIFGDVVSNRLHMQNTSKLHVPEPLETDCSMVDDTPAQLGAADAAGIASAATFDQWFEDTPGVNESAQARMRFVKDVDGAWEFEADDFRPIDGKLMSEGGYGANRNFTLDLDGQFTYKPCTNQFLSFSGDGDALVYVDGRLVLELAGNNSGISQHLELDRLGLDPNKPHTLQFFYAQRSCSGSEFSLRTNVTLDTTYKVVSPAVACSD